MEIAANQVKWKQVAAALAKRIIDGEFRVGDQLPSYDEIAKQCGTNREIVRRAVTGLQIDGIVRTESGKGTFVIRTPDSAQATEAELLDKLDRMLTRLDELEGRVAAVEQAQAPTPAPKRARRREQ